MKYFKSPSKNQGQNGKQNSCKNGRVTITIFHTSPCAKTTKTVQPVQILQLNPGYKFILLNYA